MYRRRSSAPGGSGPGLDRPDHLRRGGALRRLRGLAAGHRNLRKPSSTRGHTTRSRAIADCFSFGRRPGWSGAPARPRSKMSGARPTWPPGHFLSVCIRIGAALARGRAKRRVSEDLARS